MKVAVLNANPRRAAARGAAPCHSHMSSAGASSASGHRFRGANEPASARPATAASNTRSAGDCGGDGR
jgi:hypothetical protein